MAVFSTLRNTAVAVSALAAIAQQAAALPIAAPTSVDFDHPSKLFKRDSQVIIGALPPYNGQIPPRREFSQLQQDPYAFNIYILAMEAFQKDDQDISNPRSYYQISGIHGSPYTPWDQVSGGNNDGGYCLHGDLMFPVWHRPYLAVFEAQLYRHANAIAARFTGPDRNLHMNAAASFRIPYWDAVLNAMVPDAIGSWTQIQVTAPEGQKVIPNPLYSYRFHPLDPKDFNSSPFNQMQETVRNPMWDGQKYVSQPQVTNQQMQRIGGNLRSRAYNLLTAYRDYAAFSNHAFVSATGGNLDSIEGIHDTIHGTVGGNGGHMGVIDYAAFDPIFWLHHCNIDRLFALWEAINPGAYVTESINREGTFSQPPGTVENVNTPLTPFHSSKNAYWTAAQVADTRNLGYTYPELMGLSPGNLRGSVIGYVQRSYGATQPVNRLFAAGPMFRKHKKREEGSTMPEKEPKVGSAPKQPATLSHAPKPEMLMDHHENLVDGKTNTYNEYITNIQCNAASLGGSFNIHVFMGDVPEDKNHWATSNSLVGTYTVFTMVDPMNKVVAGTVPLTSALLNKVVAGELENLHPETVDNYLDTNLKWRVAPVDAANDLDHSAVEQLKIQVVTAKVQLPASIEELPVWGPIHPLKDVTHKPDAEPAPTSVPVVEPTPEPTAEPIPQPTTTPQ